MQTGLDSIAQVELAAALTSKLGTPGSPVDLYDHPTVGALAALLHSQAAPPVETQPTVTSMAPAFGATSQDLLVLRSSSALYPGAAHPSAFPPGHSGTDFVAPLPIARWDSDAYFHPDAATPGSISTRFGATLANTHVSHFDPELFGFSLREAQHADPHLRLLLMRALEVAPAPPRAECGVYIGCMWAADFADTLPRQLATAAATSTGTGLSFMAGRLAFAFDLQGPSTGIDTACSSSLVALHLATQGTE